MKKTALLFLIAVYSCALSAQSSIPNGNFNSWTDMGLYNVPTGWDQLNSYSACANTFTCEKGTPGVGDSSYLAVRSRDVTGLGTLPGIAVCGALDPSTHQPISGFPYTQRPHSLIGSWQTMGFNSDFGYALVLLTKWDTAMARRDTVAIANRIFRFMIMHWTTFDMPLNYLSSSIPDSAMIVFSASLDTPKDNSYLFVDNISFSGTATGIGEVSKEALFTLYPNPASDVLNILLAEEATTPIAIQLLDIQGRCVANLVKNAKTKSLSLGLSEYNLPASQYLIQLTANGKTYSQAFIKK